MPFVVIWTYPNKVNWTDYIQFNKYLDIIDIIYSILSLSTVILKLNNQGVLKVQIVRLKDFADF